ncbi:MAG: NAD-dependent epimerase/dehydratase family protein [archaeon]
MIFVTGASGFLGKYVVNELLKCNEKIRCFSNSIGNLPKNNRIEIVIGDIRDKEAVNKYVKGAKYIVHLAAALNPYITGDLYEVNIKGTKNLVDAAKKYKIKKFIFVSSEGAVQQFDEYGKSKMKAESIVKSLKNYVIIRPTVIYGAGDRKNISKLIKIVKNSPFVPLFKNGNNKLQPVYAGDVAAAIKNALSMGKGTYFAAGKEPLSLNEIITVIESCLGIKRRIRIRINLKLIKIVVALMRFYKGKMISPNLISPNIIEYFSKDQIYDISKTIKELNYKPLSFYEGIKKSI